VLALLAEAGVLDDYPFGLHAALPDRVRGRLAPELATAALAYADTDRWSSAVFGSRPRSPTVPVMRSAGFFD